jgi:hypothetical protein
VRRAATVATAVALLTGCAARPAPAQDPAPVDTAGALVPAGQGQLSQDQVTLAFRSGNLEIRFTPLDERVLRLIVPDAHRALLDLVEEQRPRVDSVTQRFGIRRPGLALVTFYGLAPDSRFDPRLLLVNVRNRIIRPVATLPLSPAFSAQQLDIRQQAMGIFIFDEPIPVTEPFAVEYLSTTVTDWERRLPRFDRERARIQARTGSGPVTGEP